MHAFCGVPGLEGEPTHHPRDEKFERASLSTTLTPSEYYLVPAEVSAGRKSPPNGVRREIKQLRRGAGDRSARVFSVLFSSLSRVRKILQALPAKFFGAVP